MEVTYWILLILLVLYIPFWIWVRISPKAKEFKLKTYGPAIMLRTKLGMRLIERFSKYNRFWRLFGTFSLIVSFLLMVTILYILIIGMLNLPNTINSNGMGIKYALAIPGLNPLLPLGFGIIGLIVAVCLHELAHGMQTASNGMGVDSTGLLHLVVPMGAFVEPNEDDVKKASRRVKLDLYTAGISTNFVIGTVAFLIFAGGMLGGISSPYGDQAAIYGITADSPAYDSGIPTGSIIDTINGVGFDLDTYDYSWEPGDTVTVGYIYRDSPGTMDLTWGVFIESVVSGSPASDKLDEHWYILSLDDGKGHYEKLYTANQFNQYMSKTSSGDVIEVEYLTSDDIRQTVSITLSDNNSIGFMGVRTTTSGISFSTPNTVLDVARNPFYGDKTITDYAKSTISYISGPFSGFSPVPDSVKWWYDVPLGDAFWWIASLFYWIFWLNILLGVSNAIPAIPFDGGFVFLGGIDWILEKLGRKDREQREELANSIAANVSTIVWIMFLILMMAVIF